MCALALTVAAASALADAVRRLPPPDRRDPEQSHLAKDDIAAEQGLGREIATQVAGDQSLEIDPALAQRAEQRDAARRRVTAPTAALGPLEAAGDRQRACDGNLC